MNLIDQLISDFSRQISGLDCNHKAAICIVMRAQTYYIPSFEKSLKPICSALLISELLKKLQPEAFQLN